MIKKAHSRTKSENDLRFEGTINALLELHYNGNSENIMWISSAISYMSLAIDSRLGDGQTLLHFIIW